MRPSNAVRHASRLRSSLLRPHRNRHRRPLQKGRRRRPQQVHPLRRLRRNRPRDSRRLCSLPVVRPFPHVMSLPPSHDARSDFMRVDLHLTPNPTCTASLVSSNPLGPSLLPRRRREDIIHTHHCKILHLPRRLGVIAVFMVERRDWKAKRLVLVSYQKDAPAHAQELRRARRCRPRATRMAFAAWRRPSRLASSITTTKGRFLPSKAGLRSFGTPICLPSFPLVYTSTPHLSQPPSLLPSIIHGK